MFTSALSVVATMLLYAAPGYLLVRTKLCPKESIASFAVLLTYVCQPCLSLYAFEGVVFTAAFAVRMLVFTGMMLAILSVMLAGAYLLLRRKQAEPKYRIATIAAAFGNFTFMGIPVVEALLPGNAEAKVYATLAFLSMSILTWTVGSAIITHDAKYIKASKIFLNPGTISFALALVLSAFSVTLPPLLSDAVRLVGRMATPVCMIVMGMRLASMQFSSLFSRPTVYVSMAAKQILMPLLALAAARFLPIGADMKLTFYVMCCMPVASNVLNFAEMLGSGMEDAADTVLLSTMSSVVTIPLLMLLV